MDRSGEKGRVSTSETPSIPTLHFCRSLRLRPEPGDGRAILIAPAGHVT